MGALFTLMPIIAQMVQKSESLDFYIKVHAFLIFYGAQYIGVAGSGVKLGISPTNRHMRLISINALTR
jgi:hypothetical protein